MIVTGMVNAISIGFKNVFNIAKTSATNIAVFASETTTPGTNFAATKAAIAISIILNKRFIVEFYPSFEIFIPAQKILN